MDSVELKRAEIVAIVKEKYRVKELKTKELKDEKLRTKTKRRN